MNTHSKKDLTSFTNQSLLSKYLTIVHDVVDHLKQKINVLEKIIIVYR